MPGMGGPFDPAMPPHGGMMPGPPQGYNPHGPMNMPMQTNGSGPPGSTQGSLMQAGPPEPFQVSYAAT